MEYSWHHTGMKSIEWLVHYLHVSVTYRQTSNIRRTEFRNLDDSRLVLQLSSPNPLKPGVKSMRKMWVKQRLQAMLQLHRSDQQVYCQLCATDIRGFTVMSNVGKRGLKQRKDGVNLICWQQGLYSISRRTDVLQRNLVKSRSREIVCYDHGIAQNNVISVSVKTFENLKPSAPFLIDFR